MQISFLTDAVTDISPVPRVYPTSKSSFCRGSGRGKGRLIDLSPPGEAASELDVSYNPLADLEPLRGMPLERLSIGNTEVSNIEPLRGMPLRVLAGWTPVADPRPLTGARWRP